MIESVITYTITEGGSWRVEIDVHFSGLLSVDMWICLLDECGFDTQSLPLPGDGDGCGEHLLCGCCRREPRPLKERDRNASL